MTLLPSASLRLSLSKRPVPGRTWPFVLSLLLLGSLLSPTVFAQKRNDAPLALRTEVNAQRVRVGDAFQVDVVLTVRSTSPVEELSLPSFSDFEVVRQSRSQRSSTQIARGRQSTEIEYRYTFILRATSPGNKKIDSATARMGKNRARSKSLILSVIPSQGAPGNGSRSGSRNGTSSGPGQGNQHESRPFFLDVSFDKEEVYVGEQVSLMVRIFATQAIDARGMKLPKLPRFWVEELENAQSRPTQQIVDGVSYYVYVVQRAALFPLDPGEHHVEPLNVTVQSGGGLFSRGKKQVLSSAPLTLTVLPLPEGAPNGFEGGNIGFWRVSVLSSAKTTPAGQPVTVKIVVQGEGNVEEITAPVFDAAALGDARRFPPTTTTQKSVDSGRLYGRKVVEMLVQPMTPGRLRLPSLVLPFFNPRTKKYDVARSRPVVVRVTAATAQPQGKGSGRQQIATGFRPVHVSIAAKQITTPWMYRPSFALAVGASGSLGFALFLLGLFRGRSRETAEGRLAARRAQRRQALQKAEQEKDLAQARIVLLDALADRSGDAVRALTNEELTEHLVTHGVPSLTAEAASRFMEAVDSVRYAPPSGTSRRELFDEAKRLLSAVDAGNDLQEREQGGAA